MTLHPQRVLRVAAFAERPDALVQLTAMLHALDVALVTTAPSLTSFPTLDPNYVDLRVVALDASTDVGLAAIVALRQAPPFPTVALYPAVVHNRVLLACEYGIGGHALATVAPTDLAYGMQLVARGGQFLCPAIWASFCAGYIRHLEELTHHEALLVTLVAAGEPNRAIAATLAISERLVEYRLHQLCAKVQVANRTELAAWWGRKVGVQSWTRRPRSQAQQLAPYSEAQSV